MSRNIALLFALLLLLSISIPSSAGAMPTNTLTILPGDCRTLVGEELPLTLDGDIPPNTIVRWGVNSGGITSMLTGSDAVFIAPPTPMVVTISVSLSPAKPGMESPITRQCIVTSRNSAPRGLAQAAGMDTPGMPSFSMQLNLAPN